MDPRCRVELFGEFRLVQEGQITTRFRTQKVAAVLAYLALYIRQEHARERIVDLFWPDMDLDAGRNNLSTLLVSLRRQLEPMGVPQGRVLIADRRTVQLNAAVVATDVAEFDALLKAADKAATTEEQREVLERAVALYRGDLLPGIYDDWAIQEQDRCRARYVDALVQWGRCLQDTGEREAAIAVLERAITADPYREEVYATRMRLQAGLGSPASALETYRQLEEFLKENLGVTPGGKARALAELLRKDPKPLTEAVVSSPVVTRPATKPKSAPPPSAQRSTPGASFAGGTPALPGTPTLQLPPTLPLQMTRFFGREEELARLKAFISDGFTRLLTLTGPGGTGKTRLAIETVRSVAPGFEGRVWFVSLADLFEPTLIPFALASALNLSALERNDPLEAVVTALGSDPCLLVLDNFEHLLRMGGSSSKGDYPIASGAAALVRLLLGRVPGLTCLVTSREPLHLDGEQEFSLTPLSLPSREMDIERLMEFSSVALFVDRARLVRPDFTLTPSNRESIAALCLRLEGMPLAIEMAAAWSNVHTPARILQRLEQQLDLLVSRRRDLPPRQQSLRATIEWSYDLLSEPERVLLGRLSVFAGGWTLEAAEQICADTEESKQEIRNKGNQEASAPSLHQSLPSSLFPSILPEEVLDLLTSLMDKSLVRYEMQEEEGRYRSLETIREYAQEKLAEIGETERMRARHQEYFLGFAERAEAFLGGAEQATWLDRLESETDNFRAALNGAGAEEAERALRLAGALQRFWHMRGYYAEGRAHLKRALERQGMQGATAVRAKALVGAGILAWAQGDFEAARLLYDESVGIFQKLGDRKGVARGLGRLGVLAAEQGDYGRARERYAECMTIFQELGQKDQVATVLYNMGNIATNQSDYTQAKTLYEESLAIRRGLGDSQGVAWCLHSLGCVMDDQGNYAAGQAFLEESLTLFKALGEREGIAYVLQTLGTMAGDQADYERAKALFEESLALYKTLGNRQGIAQVCNHLSRLAVIQEDYEQAQARAEESLTIFRELGDRKGSALSLRNLGLVAARRSDYATVMELYREALVIYRELENKRGVLQTLEGMASGFAQSSELQKGACLWGAVERMREVLNVPRTPNVWEIYNQQVAQVRLDLGEAAFDAAWEEGYALTREQAIVYALEKS